jgi:uncharacterized membrane protein YphA (DoxX/SURF4 family)
VFFLAMGTNKLAWIGDPVLLEERFVRWLPMAAPYARWYLETIAIPGGAVFARLVPIAEITTACLLIAGIQVRVVAAAAMFMVFNFHFATSAFSSSAFLRDGTGLPVLGALLAIALAGDAMPWCVGVTRQRTAEISGEEAPYSPAP